MIALKKIACVLFLLLVTMPVLFASDGEIVSYLGIEQGLSNNSVRCIFQDKKGFMWFGTYDGLNRYDGYEFKVFRNKYGDSSSLVNNWIYTVCEGVNDELWVGTRQGLCIFNAFNEKFSSAFYDDTNGHVKKIDAIVKDIKTDALGNILVGTQGAGLFWFPKGRHIGERIKLDDRQLDYDVQSILQQGNALWVFIQNKGLYRYNIDAHKLTLINATIKSALSIELENSNIWIGTAQGIFQFNINTGLVTPRSDATSSVFPSSIIEMTFDKTNNSMWVGMNGNGLRIIDLATGKIQTMISGDTKHSLTSNVIYSIYEDVAGRKWIGTLRGGVNVLDAHKKRFSTIAHDAGDPGSLTNNFIYSFCEAPDEKIWIGLDGAGVNIWDRKKNTFSSLKHSTGEPSSLSDNSVTQIKKDHLNNIWLTTFSGGINRFNSANRTFDHFSCVDPISGKNNTVVFSMFEDEQNNLWAGTLRTADGVHGGLYRYNPNNKSFEIFDSNLSDLFVIQGDLQHNLWAGDLTRLILIDRKEHHHSYYTMGAPVHTITEDKNGNFWVGTEGAGLVLFDRVEKKIKQRYTTENGLCSNEVLNILEDSNGDLWISTFNGLSRFDVFHQRFRNYYQSDGLQSNQFHYNAATRLSTGELMFGGIKGFTIFSPADIGIDKTMPPLWITGVQVNNQRLQDQSGYITKSDRSGIVTVKVPYSKASFSFDFAALEYSAPAKIKYAYKMDGWDHDWTYTGSVRSATYTRLQEGTYTFRVKNSNSEGIWNGREQTLEIIVLPPWYRSWWAYAIYLIAIASVVYFYWLYKDKQTKLQYEVKIAHLNAEKEKAELEKERTERETDRIVNEKEKELNERRLSFFTNMAHEFRTPLTLIINPVKELLHKKNDDPAEKEDLGIVFRNSRRLLSLVDQLLLFRKAESGLDTVNATKLDFYVVCQEVYLCFVQQAKAKDVQYDYDCKQQKLEMMADREKVEIILYNLLSNALKYVPRGGKVSLQVRNRKAEIVIRVTNTGPGIPPEVGGKLFDKFYRMPGKNQVANTGFGIGLYLVKYFTEAHHGTIDYTSEPDKETIFTLVLPKGVSSGDDQKVESVPANSIMLDELREETIADVGNETEKQISPVLMPLTTDQQSVLIVDDDVQMRNYVAKIFKRNFNVHEAGSAEEGLQMVKQLMPDIVISDIQMEGMNGIELCKTIKQDTSLSHIPVILLTGASSSALKIEGVENGADDYIVKPFEKELLTARVNNLLQSRSNLQKYFFSEITLSKTNSYKISEEHKLFLDKCISIVEEYLNEDGFSIGALAREMGMSHSSVYKKIKLISGQSLTSFIRFVRLRKAAELFINTNSNVNEVGLLVGMNDGKYFREQFNKVFGMNPSDYIKKYRRSFQEQYRVTKDKDHL